MKVGEPGSEREEKNETLVTTESNLPSGDIFNWM
jgi:hypothetical protein